MSSEPFYHVRVKEGEVGRLALLPGDPARVKLIGEQLKEPKIIASHREFTVLNGYLDDELVTVCSTGIGGPSAAIAVEELSRAGVKTMIRVGTCGAIQREVKIGDLVIATAAVRLDGTSKQYVVPEYPAVASPQIVYALSKAAKELGFRFHIGLCASTDAFYIGQGRHGFQGFRTAESRSISYLMRRLRVLCFEMEASTIFTLSTIYGLRAGAVFVAIPAKASDPDRLGHELRVSKSAVEALRILMKWDKEAEGGIWLPK
ncbi:MAG: nucleoside phosphorylase [Nitrososphaerales archaeon]